MVKKMFLLFFVLGSKRFEKHWFKHSTRPIFVPQMTILESWVMVYGGQMALTSVELFNYQTGQACSIESLPTVAQGAMGGLFDNYPVFCGGANPINLNVCQQFQKERTFYKEQILYEGKYGSATNSRCNFQKITDPFSRKSRNHRVAKQKYRYYSNFK